MKRVEIENLLKKVIISPSTPVSEAISILDRAGKGVLLLCEEDRKLVGILTDGDIRRAFLQGVPFDEPCRKIASLAPLVALPHISPVDALHLMDHGKEFLVNHLPLVDEQGRVVDLLSRNDLISEDQPALSAVIMAGGLGTRLRPLTEKVPKPMLPVGDRPLLELIIEQLRQAGIHHVSLTTHYKGDIIAQHFGDGSEFGVDIRYVKENEPLGTAGALSLLETSGEPQLVINGDVLTRIDFRAMLNFHRKYSADMTVAVRRYDMQVPFGVLECQGTNVNELREKPTYSFFVNAGIYLLEPSAHRYIPKSQHFDMTDLIQRLLDKGRSVVSFPIMEYWLDIGQHADYEQAQKDMKKGD
ncbi:MAG: nucleotidyltransferase family protein [Planctomycetota bacterium]|jgi:dTDP-glucose pyrophosphorylase/CBS domain-containing protein